MGDTDPERLADVLDDDADELGKQSEKLQAEIDLARQDWRAKREDDGVPGAPKPLDEESGEDDPDG